MGAWDLETEVDSILEAYDSSGPEQPPVDEVIRDALSRARRDGAQQVIEYAWPFLVPKLRCSVKQLQDEL